MPPHRIHWLVRFVAHQFVDCPDCQIISKAKGLFDVEGCTQKRSRIHLLAGQDQSGIPMAKDKPPCVATPHKININRFVEKLEEVRPPSRCDGYTDEPVFHGDQGIASVFVLCESGSAFLFVAVTLKGHGAIPLIT